MPPEDEEMEEVARAEEQRAEAAVDDTTSSSADSEAEPPGSGPRGVGPPLQVGAHHRRRSLCDGGGLCSLGLWPPAQRPMISTSRLEEVRRILDEGIRRLDTLVAGGYQGLFDRLAAAEVQEMPFPTGLVESIAESFMRLWDAEDAAARPQSNDRQMAIRGRLLQCLLREANDPDWKGMKHYFRGVRLGVNRRSPRTLAVFGRKKRWRVEGQSDADKYHGEELMGMWRENYKSASAHASLVRSYLEQHARDGGQGFPICLELSEAEARERLPNLTVMSLGVVSKKEEPTEIEDIRVVNDGTHGVQVNSHIRQRDQDRAPTAADAKRLQRAQSEENGIPLGLAIDVKGAHRIPPVHDLDWRHQGCRATEGTEVYIYMYGLFGITVSAYWWARLGGAILRCAHVVARPRQSLWVLLMADDFKVESTAPDPKREVVWFILLLSALGVPLSWSKTQGGNEVAWIGFHLILSEYKLGITQKRADWAVAWLRREATNGKADLVGFRAALGRLSFLAGALEYDRPFLAPLFTFLSVMPHFGIRPLPLYVRVIMAHLANRIERRRH